MKTSASTLASCRTTSSTLEGQAGQQNLALADLRKAVEKRAKDAEPIQQQAAKTAGEDYQAIIVGTLVALAGCGNRPAVEPEPRVVCVEEPVQVPCRVKAPAIPAWAAEGLRKEDSLEAKVRALLAERRQRSGYERELVAAVASCQ